jgi:hypothetical protein
MGYVAKIYVIVRQYNSGGIDFQCKMVGNGSKEFYKVQ